MNEAVGENNCLDKLGGKRWSAWFFKRTSSVNLLGAFYHNLPIVIRDAYFGMKN